MEKLLEEYYRFQNRFMLNAKYIFALIHEFIYGIWIIIFVYFIGIYYMLYEFYNDRLRSWNLSYFEVFFYFIFAIFI